MKTRDALQLAYDMGYDLVLVAPSVAPPVAKIMDYGKFKYEEKKKHKQNKKVGEVKEISMRPNISDNDLSVKIKKIKKFLGEGRKVKVRIFFRGREIVHTERGYDLANKIKESLALDGVIEVEPKLEGVNMIFLFRPLKKQGGSNAQNEN